MAAGLSKDDARGMVEANMQFVGAAEFMLARGWKVKPELPHTAHQEATWYIHGWKPYLLVEGKLHPDVLGVWGRITCRRP